LKTTYTSHLTYLIDIHGFFKRFTASLQYSQKQTVLSTATEKWVISQS
jgi:hypothetical protein